LLPASIHHAGLDYDLQHLAQKLFLFSWQGSDGSNFHFSVRVRYTDHCFSTTAGLVRVFDVDRYKWSLELPTIVQGLFAKPTFSIQLTPEQNGYVFRLSMNHPLPNGEKYYCFLRLKRSKGYVAGESPLKLDLFIESAHSRAIAPQRSKERIMFGRLAERLIR
jgi:hypothetical protein